MGSKASSCLGSFWIFGEEDTLISAHVKYPSSNLPDYIKGYILVECLHSSGEEGAASSGKGYPSWGNSLMLPQTNEL